MEVTETQEENQNIFASKKDFQGMLDPFWEDRKKLHVHIKCRKCKQMVVHHVESVKKWEAEEHHEAQKL